MDSLFNIEPTKPTPLQAARRALADAERELELVEAEELSELKKIQNN